MSVRGITLFAERSGNCWPAICVDERRNESAKEDQRKDVSGEKLKEDGETVKERGGKGKEPEKWADTRIQGRYNFTSLIFSI